MIREVTWRKSPGRHATGGLSGGFRPSSGKRSGTTSTEYLFETDPQVLRGLVYGMA